MLNRAVWHSRLGCRVFLGQLLQAFVPAGPVLLGVDDTIERRRGKRIRAKGIYRDPVRSSKSFLVKTSGLRWLSMMLLAPVPWTKRDWALPFLTVLAPSQRSWDERGRRHKTLTDWARQVALQARRWLPGRELVLVDDSAFAVLTLLTLLTLLTAVVRDGTIGVIRLRLDAALYEPGPLRQPRTNGRPRKKCPRLPARVQRLNDTATVWQPVTVTGWYGTAARRLEICSETSVWFHSGQTPLPIRWVMERDPLGECDPQALLCTDPARAPFDIIGWFIQRWPIKVTFREVRDHLGVETQRQRTDQVIARTTPCLLGPFSITALLGARLHPRTRLAVSATAWYCKPHPTFTDTLAAVRRDIWRAQGFQCLVPSRSWKNSRARCVRVSPTPFARPREVSQMAKVKLSKLSISREKHATRRHTPAGHDASWMRVSQGNERWRTWKGSTAKSQR